MTKPLTTTSHSSDQCELQAARRRRVDVETQVQARPQPKDVPITRGMLIRTAEKYGNRLGFQDEDTFLSRITHLHLNNSRITEISPDLASCRGIRVLYLYDNCIERISGLDFATRLTHLYLQNNEISRIEGLESLVSLQKLYLDGNRIAKVGSLAACMHLEEIHISRQMLGLDMHMELDAGTMAGLGEHGSLRVFNCAGNGLKDISCLRHIPSLTKVDLSDSSVSELQSVIEFLAGCPELVSLNLKGCPVVGEAKYRDRIISVSESLTELDKERVPPNHRDFLIGFAKTRKQRIGRSWPKTVNGDEEGKLEDFRRGQFIV